MTLDSTTSRVQYTQAGATTEWPVTFKFLDNEDLIVVTTLDDVDTVLTLDTDYTVTGAGDDEGGTVTISPAVASGTLVTIYRQIDLDQPTQLTVAGGWYPTVHEAVFDRLTMQIQQVQEQADRSLKIGVTDTRDPEDIIDDIFEARDDAQAAAASAEDAATRAEVAATTAAYYGHEGTLSSGEGTITLPWAYDTSVGVEVYLSGVKQAASALDFTDAYTVTLDTTVSADTDYEVVSSVGSRSGLDTMLAASGGSALVGFLQDGTGASARTVQSKLQDFVSVFDFMSAAQIADVKAGTALVDVTAAIQKALDSGAGLVFAPAGKYLVTATLKIPVYTKLFGVGYLSVVKPSSTGIFTSGFVIMYNSSDGSTWDSAYPGGPSGGVEDIYINANGGDTTSKGIFTAGKCDLVNLRFSYLAQAIKTTGEYDDHVFIDRIFITHPQSTAYAIEVGLLGDGLTIGRVLFDDGGSAINKNAISVSSCHSGKIVNQIQGNIYVSTSDSFEITGAHLEDGSITINESRVTISNSHLWNQGTKASITTTATNGRHILAVRDCQFLVDINANASDVYDYDIKADTNYVVFIENCSRRTLKQGNTALVENMGVQVEATGGGGLVAWNQYSPILSRHGRIEQGNAVPMENRNVYGPDGAIYPFVGLSTDPSAVWTGDTGTYYYKIAYIYDTTRLVGRADANGERSVSLTNGGNAALLTIGTVRHMNCFVRVWRGTTSGSYDKYVDIPSVSLRLLYDTGEIVNGFKWQARTAGEIDATYDATEITIGRGVATVRGPGTTAPTVGTWAAGDIFLRKAPSAGGFLGSICVAAGTPGTWKTFGAISS